MRYANKQLTGSVIRPNTMNHKAAVINNINITQSQRLDSKLV